MPVTLADTIDRGGTYVESGCFPLAQEPAAGTSSPRPARCQWTHQSDKLTWSKYSQ